MSTLSKEQELTVDIKTLKQLVDIRLSVCEEMLEEVDAGYKTDYIKGQKDAYTEMVRFIDKFFPDVS